MERLTPIERAVFVLREACGAADATSWADGGGRVATARRPVRGRTRVARYVAGILARFGSAVDTGYADVNGEPAITAWSDGRLLAVFTIELDEGLIAALRIIANLGQVALSGPATHVTSDEAVRSHDR